MPRWRQTTNPETGKSEFIPLDEAAAKVDAGHAIHGTIEPFVSPLDGSVISGRKAYREHCKKHGVVPAAEFDQKHYEREAEKRAKFFKGERTPEETRAVKQEMYERLTREGY